MTLSVLMVTYNSADVVEGALKSVEGLWDELLVGDGGSRDGTVEIARKYGAKVYRLDPRLRGDDKKERMTGKNLGERKQELVEKAKGDWILVLDADERVSGELKKEIASIIRPPRRSHGLSAKERIGLPPSEVVRPVAYRIQYQNYVFGRPVYYGGEKYAKVRLFKKDSARISPEPLHEEVRVVGAVGEVRGKIHHYSYRTPWQLFSKFTRYAWIAARMEIAPPSERSRNDILQKLFLYGPHMFWARFIKEKGYKDGWRGLVLALAFGYMEGLTYWFVFIRSLLAILQGETFKDL